MSLVVGSRLLASQFVLLSNGNDSLNYRYLQHLYFFLHDCRDTKVSNRFFTLFILNEPSIDLVANALACGFGPDSIPSEVSVRSSLSFVKQSE